MENRTDKACPALHLSSSSFLSCAEQSLRPLHHAHVCSHRDPNQWPWMLSGKLIFNWKMSWKSFCWLHTSIKYKTGKKFGGITGRDSHWDVEVFVAMPQPPNYVNYVRHAKGLAAMAWLRITRLLQPIKTRCPCPKVMTGTAPEYPSDFFPVYSPSRTIRSSVVSPDLEHKFGANCRTFC